MPPLEVAQGMCSSREKIQKEKNKIVLDKQVLSCYSSYRTYPRGENTMKINEIVIDVLKNTIKPDGRKKTQVDIATALGVKQQHINDRLKNENMKFNTAIEMLAEMGYEVVVRPADASDKRESYVVERGEARIR